MKCHLPDEAATRRLGADFAAVCESGAVIYLKGELGAGKSTFVRGFLGALGYKGAVKSPTYTLIEPYETAEHKVFHLDLYRLADPEELEYLGMRDLADPHATLLIEWPEQGAGFLPTADIVVELHYQDHAREATVTAYSEKGRHSLSPFN